MNWCVSCGLAHGLVAGDVSTLGAADAAGPTRAGRGLQGKEWLAGPCSLADITLFIGLETAHHGEFTLDPAWGNLQRWYAAMKARPSASA